MAKRSRIDTEITIKLILDEAFEQILTIGFENMSYTSLSNATGISRTGISHHFPRKADFLSCLDSRISARFCEGLDFSSVQLLESSWRHFISQDHAKAVLKLFFSLCASNQQIQGRFNTVNDIRYKALMRLGDEGGFCIDRLIGQSAVTMFSAQTEEAVAA
ncbi:MULTISPECIES: TetR family transcriptional regulator [Shewanella]|uniref:TetR family transcriptional regulator n=1 Tax=Shewanella japonica TaxID=93973 RepID=A0ABN4YJD2_9GAMM|nr:MULTISPECIES: TetR family transcriptional regulator [Shewanella]ARD23672.1 TetR family transcriptional regulator [Shewanella japonica]KPZ69727.1 hypothetical protein AN944_02708 [Shewanella sp. P1-14-1]